MKKILIGAERSKGSFTEGNRTIKYDNIKLYVANYREKSAHGFSISKNADPVKIRTVDFAQVTGISVKEFLSTFEKNYMFRKVRVIGEENDYGSVDVTEVKFSEKNCFELWKELKELEAEAAIAKALDEDSEEDYDEEESDEDFEEAEGVIQVNRTTGEVIESK